MTAPQAGARRAVARAGLVASVLTLGLVPLALAVPAYAADPTPTVTEPPGGATCAPDLPPGDCRQEGASPDPTSTETPTDEPTATEVPTPTDAPTPTDQPSPTDLPTTAPTPSGATVGEGESHQNSGTSGGGRSTSTNPSSVPATLPRTGAGSAIGWAATGSALLGLGAILVVAGRRPAGD